MCDKELNDHHDLLYVCNELNSHYSCIININTFIASQLTKHEEKIKVCKRCFAHFWGQNANKKLDEHKELCQNFKPAVYKFPNKKYISFENYHHSKRLRFVIYADFE